MNWEKHYFNSYAKFMKEHNKFEPQVIKWLKEDLTEIKTLFKDRLAYRHGVLISYIPGDKQLLEGRANAISNLLSSTTRYYAP